MSQRRLIDLSVAALVALGVWLARMEHDGPVLPLLVLAAAAASWVLTDVLGRVRLSGALVDLAIFAVAAHSVWRVIRSPGTLEVTQIIEPLACVQILLLFEQKTFRTWWDLTAISLFEVALAAAFCKTTSFGLLLIAYVSLAAVVVSLLFLLRERVRYAPTNEGGAPAALAEGWFGGWRRVLVIALATLLVGPLSLFLRRCSFRLPPPAHPFSPAASSPSSAEHGQASAGRAGIGREFYTRMARILLVAIPVAAVLFVLLPRFGEVPMSPAELRALWTNSPATPVKTAGYSGEMQLGELGAITENAAQVLDVELFHLRTGGHYAASGSVYFRGNSLARYSDGRWRSEDVRLPGPARGFGSVQGKLGEALVRQEIILEPLDNDVVFCIWPIVFLRNDPRIRTENYYQQLLRHPALRQRRFSTTLATSAFSQGVQADLVPASSPINRSLLLKLPSQSLAGLAATAQRWLAEADLLQAPTIARARHLESRLRDSGDFEYTTTAPNRDPALDPIEDFVTKNPQGHCEYFATALALMLRSQNIPSRVLLGYRCDENDNLGNLYRVRQSHAHAWVEVFLAAGEVPVERPDHYAASSWDEGAWLRLDPTPAYRSDADRTLARDLRYWMNRVDSLWAACVAGMNRTRQEEIIYRPLMSFTRQLRNAADPVWWSERLAAWNASSATLGEQLAQAPWPVWLVGSPVVLVLLAVAFRLRFALARLFLVFPTSRRRAPLRATPAVGFYLRFERILAERGLARCACQTHREFATVAAQQLLRATGQLELADLPARVTEAFYRVRFGLEALDPMQNRLIEEALRRLQQHASPQGANGRHMPG